MIIAISAADVAELAARAALEARSYAPKTSQRRAAAALYVALITTKNVDLARAALADFAAPVVVADALQLLHKLAVTLTAQPAHPLPEEPTT